MEDTATDGCPVSAILDEIDRAIASELWILALNGLVAIPDICGALESDSGEATGKQFKAWFDTYLKPEYPASLDGGEFYKIRCSMLHTGATAGQNYSRVVFLKPGPNFFDSNILNDALQLDLPSLAHRMRTAVRTWYAKVGQTSNVQLNQQKIIRWYPGGMPPYVDGIDVLS